jgi:SH3 domain protein
MLRKHALLCLALGAWAGSAGAEIVYVTDSLRLGLHAAPDTSDRPFENLVSGTSVEVLERNSSYARVRLADGREGWVKATFLVAEKPAAARVLELEAELGELESAAVAAKTAQAAAEHELAGLRSELQATTGSAESIQETIERLRRETRAHEERLESYRYTLPLAWVIPAVVVALTGGFLMGLWWLDAWIRRRHGGFRVY